MTLAVALVAWSGLVGPRLSPRTRLLLHGTLAGLLVRSTGAPLGMTPPVLWQGLRLGLPTAAVVSAAVGGSTFAPSVRRGMSARRLPDSVPEWLAVHIPLGTVWSEEAAYRAALGTAAADAFGARAGRVVQATAFGLSHVADARGAGEPVLGTVLVTGVAGWVFGWLYDRTGSLTAPMLAHLAINESGAVAAVWVRRRR